MTEKRFTLDLYPDEEFDVITDNLNGDAWGFERYYRQAICNLLNELNDEKEKWKSASVSALNENSLLWNEISILREQGAEPSDAFKKYLESISTEHTKFWQRKLKQAKMDKVMRKHQISSVEKLDQMLVEQKVW